MRKTCSQCASKHLGQARALLLEARKGYPDHYWFALGHLAEAEDELEAEYPALTATIRQHRKALEADPDYRVPFSALVLAVAGQTGYDLTEYWKPCFVRRLAMMFSKVLKFFAPLLFVGVCLGDGLQIVGAPVDQVARSNASVAIVTSTNLAAQDAAGKYVPTSRTITVNGQVGALNSNVAFTVEANPTLQDVLYNGNTATNDMTIDGQMTVGNASAYLPLVVISRTGQKRGLRLEWPQSTNWLSIWSANTVNQSYLSCAGELVILPGGDTVISLNGEKVRVSTTGFSVYNQNAVFGRHSNGYTPVSTVEVFGNLRVTQTNSIIGINARSDAGPAAITNAAQFFATNAAAAEMFVMDGEGNVTQLSTHEGLTHVAKSWNVYTGTGRVIDLDALADAVQKLTGRNDIVRDLSLVPVDWDAEQEGKRQARIAEQAKADAEIAEWEADKSEDKPPKPTRPPDYVKAAKPKWLQDWERETKENE